MNSSSHSWRGDHTHMEQAGPRDTAASEASSKPSANGMTEDCVVTEQRASPPLQQPPPQSCVFADMASPVNSSSGHHLSPQRLAFDTVQRPNNPRHRVSLQKKEIHALTRENRLLREQRPCQGRPTRDNACGSAALVRLKQAVVRRQAKQLATTGSIVTIQKTGERHESFLSTGKTVGNKMEDVRMRSKTTSSAVPDEVPTTAVPSTASKPFLKRRSQAIPMQQIPDWSAVKPRTHSKLDPNLILRKQANASLPDGHSAAPATREMASSRGQIGAVSRNSRQKHSCSADASTKARNWRSQRATARKPWGSTRPSSSPPHFKIPVASQASAPGGLEPPCKFNHHVQEYFGQAPYRVGHEGDAFASWEGAPSFEGPLGSAFAHHQRDMLGPLVQHVDTLITSMGRAIKRN